MEITSLNKGALIEHKNEVYKITLGFKDEKGNVYIIRKCSGKKQYSVVREEELLIKNEENGTTE